MGWDRQDTRRYYSRSRKVGGRVVREYVGGGERGEAAQREDEQRRLELRQQRELERIQREQLLTADAALDALASTMDVLIAAALLSAGYHRHQRTWRRRAG
jgi:hypothetical protein